MATIQNVEYIIDKTRLTFLISNTIIMEIISEMSRGILSREKIVIGEIVTFYNALHIVSDAGNIIHMMTIKNSIIITFPIE